MILVVKETRVIRMQIKGISDACKIDYFTISMDLTFFPAAIIAGRNSHHFAE